VIFGKRASYQYRGRVLKAVRAVRQQDGTWNDYAGEDQQQFSAEAKRGAENQSHNSVRTVRKENILITDTEDKHRLCVHS
jgi:hypothetical protein